jgi:hypothetical protein
VACGVAGGELAELRRNWAALTKQRHQLIGNPEARDVPKVLRDARWIVDDAASATFDQNANQAGAGNA